MRAETRHQLKQDRFNRVTMDAAEATVHWSVEHRSTVIIGALVLAAVAAAITGGWYYIDQQNDAASALLTQAVRTLDTPVRPAGVPAQPDEQSFASLQERDTAAQKQLQAIVDKYRFTHTAETARYLLGTTAAEMGDNTTAERDLKDVASAHNSDLAALAKFALATVYRNIGRPKDAIDLYNQLIAKPTDSVGKASAQMELADTYQAENQPAEARRVYEQIQKENPSSDVAQLASQKLQTLK